MNTSIIDLFEHPYDFLSQEDYAALMESIRGWGWAFMAFVLVVALLPLLPKLKLKPRLRIPS